MDGAFSQDHTHAIQRHIIKLKVLSILKKSGIALIDCEVLNSLASLYSKAIEHSARSIKNFSSDDILPVYSALYDKFSKEYAGIYIQKLDLLLSAKFRNRGTGEHVSLVQKHQISNFSQDY